MPTRKSQVRHTAARGASTRSRSKSGQGSSRPSRAGRKYSPKAGEYVAEEMKEMKEGKLKSGHSGKPVHNPKQAIAIGLSEARRAGAKVPKKPPRKAA
jgi:Family of unknown function (DUF6496)